MNAFLCALFLFTFIWELSVEDYSFAAVCFAASLYFGICWYGAA